MFRYLWLALNDGNGDTIQCWLFAEGNQMVQGFSKWYAERLKKSLSLHTSPSGPLGLAYPGFCSIKRLGIFLPPPPPCRMLVHRRVIPSITFAGTHLYTWVERNTVRGKCLPQELIAMSPARPRTRTARSGVERTQKARTKIWDLPSFIRKNVRETLGHSELSASPRNLDVVFNDN